MSARRVRTGLRTTLFVAVLSGVLILAPAALPQSRPSAGGTASAPGDLVTAVAIDAPGFWYANVWAITYRSTSQLGESITVSGTLIVPLGADANTPIIGYAPTAHGLGDQCAPSAHLKAGDEFDRVFIHQYAARGFAVAVTDYEGIGTPGEPTLLAGRAHGQTTLDVVRAAQRLEDAGLSPTAPVAVVGYSQGGHATGWAAQLAPRYAPELNIKAFAVGAPPANLRMLAEFNDGSIGTGLVMAVLYGLDVAYPDLSLDPFLNEDGRAAFADLRDDCIVELFLKFAGHSLSEYTTADVLDHPDWKARMRQQNLGGRVPRAPVLLYQSNADELVPVAMNIALRDRWCDAGANVTFRPTDTGTHAISAVHTSPFVTDWVADHLAGEPTGGNC